MNPKTTAADIKAICAAAGIETQTETEPDGRTLILTNRTGIRRWVDYTLASDPDAHAQANARLDLLDATEDADGPTPDDGETLGVLFDSDATHYPRSERRPQ